MLFTSIIFFLFLACVLSLYYLISPKYRNYILIISSCLFYMYVDIAYIFLIMFIITVNYFLGVQIHKVSRKQIKLRLLQLSMLVNIGTLIFFKYWNFIIENLFGVIGSFQLTNKLPILDIALPLGLSYYIFQTIGYTIDVFRGTHPAEKNFFNFSLFTLFFPKLLVGPIERANHFLPQIRKQIFFNKENIIEGSKRIAWGLFKKLVVANRISVYQDAVISSVSHQSGSTILFATILYTLQVYADFSGYTDIAIGTARLFGFDLIENFKRPLFAKSISDFWRRWHISLSSWVNDYIFNPLALKRRGWGNWGVFYALVVSFLVIGIWHGASWNYVVFGLLQAAALILETSTRRVRKRISKKTNSIIYNFVSIILTFSFVSFSLIIFRSETWDMGMAIIKGLFSAPGSLFYDTPSTLLYMFLGCGILLIHDVQQEFKLFKFSFFTKKNPWWLSQMGYAILLIYVLLAGVFDGGQFIYFAF